MQDLTRQGPAVDARLFLKFGFQFRRKADVGRLIKCCHFISPCYDIDIILHHNATRCHPMIKPEYLKECLEYNPETGDIIWKTRPRHHFSDHRAWKTWNSRWSGHQAGAITEYGYRRISINWRLYLAHRIAWAIMTGSFPEKEVDHIDHNRCNNSWDNLREVTRGENSKNQTISTKNSSGLTGVSWSKQKTKWRAVVCTKTKAFFKNFDSFDDAAQAVLAARKERNFHDNHGKTL